MAPTLRGIHSLPLRGRFQNLSELHGRHNNALSAFQNPVINFVWYKLPWCHLFKQRLHFFQRTQSGQSGTNPILLFRVTDHSRSHFKNKCRGLRHSATGTHRGQVPSPPIPENTFIHSKTQQLWPRMTRWEPLDSRARFSILTAGFQSPVRLEKVGSGGKRGREDTPHTHMCLGTRRNQCPERPKKLKKKFLPTLVGDSILPISLHLLRSYLTPRQDKY